VSVFVIDASVAAKWFLPAEDGALADESLHLLRRYANGEIRFLVPDLFWAELGNIFWKAVRQGRWSKTSVDTAVAALKTLKLTGVPSEDLLERALTIATVFDRTVYDSLYVALAIDCRSYLVTADERLANSLAAHLPVKWLGSV